MRWSPMQCLGTPRRARRCGTTTRSTGPVMNPLLRTLRDKLLRSIAEFRAGPAYKTKFTEELPQRLSDHTLYLLGTPRPWSAALLCPCGCRELIQLSLLEQDSPSWRLSWRRKKRVTLEPSIWRTKG